MTDECCASVERYYEGQIEKLEAKVSNLEAELSKRQNPEIPGYIKDAYTAQRCLICDCSGDGTQKMMLAFINRVIQWEDVRPSASLNEQEFFRLAKEYEKDLCDIVASDPRAAAEIVLNLLSDKDAIEHGGNIWGSWSLPRLYEFKSALEAGKVWVEK